MPFATSLGLFIMLSANPAVNSGSLGPSYPLHKITGFKDDSNAFAYGVNNAGVIDGVTYYGSSYYGLLRQTDGTLSEFQAPSGIRTVAYGIDSNGTEVGTAYPTHTNNEGFVRTGAGAVTTVTYPGSNETYFAGTNQNGSEIVGGYYPAGSDTSYGLIDRAGTLISFSAPAGVNARSISIAAVNDRRETVGAYTSKNTYAVHGWSRIAGVFTTINYPGAVLTEVEGINNTGTMVGIFEDSAYVLHGFMLDPRGVFHQIDVTGADHTQVWGINDRLELVGTYTINNHNYAFFAKPN